MSAFFLHSSAKAASLLATILLIGYRTAASEVPPEAPVQEQPVILNRGPVHEAFAEPVTLQRQDGLIAPRQPPLPIKEVPPSEKPEGKQIVWIPGYWSWDTDRNDYIWISACWRAAPPDSSWTPGYWTPVTGGWEWITGFWKPDSVQHIAYLPEPPVIEDLEPITVQSSPDMIWVPPCMYWSYDRYIRRDGYWLAAQPNWIWVPSHYITTPHGSVFAKGHWDYPLERRGVLFAPVYFPKPLYQRSSFTFTPGIVVDLGLLKVNLFSHPRYHHYYFGDYYDSAYLTLGIYPWFDSRRHHTWNDPIFEHDRWQHHRTDPHWEQNQRTEYRRRYDDKTLRPPRTFDKNNRRMTPPPPHQGKIAPYTQICKPAYEFPRHNDPHIQREAKKPGFKITLPVKTSNGVYFPSHRHAETRPPLKQRPRTTTPKGSKFSGKTGSTPDAFFHWDKTRSQPSIGRNPSEKMEPHCRHSPLSPKKNRIAPPDTMQKNSINPPRKPSFKPERRQIQTSPAAGNSGKHGFIQKNQPAPPPATIKKWRDTP